MWCGVTERIKTMLRLDAELHKRLSDAADSYGLPVNYLAARLLTEALDNLVPANEFRFTRPREAT